MDKKYTNYEEKIIALMNEIIEFIYEKTGYVIGACSEELTSKIIKKQKNFRLTKN